jgi:hypothetical protein
MESIHNSPSLDRAKEKRIELCKACESLSKNIDQAVEAIRKEEKQIFNQPYKDWRTNG